ncbi:flagellar hook assembly protein FlgD [Lysinimonas soli]|uniref:Flagellar hook assembly protein FlgD n=1 Tax=Lysinimonas soli TaxID=1074233 RepID=A0ABW0NRD6_9MICO
MSITAPANNGASASLYTNSTTGTAAKNQQMNSQMFLQLLVTQLKTQDPNSPMDSNSMITQTSQLASMQALTTLSDTQSANYSLQQRESASQLIGLTASYLDAGGVTRSGTVTGASFGGKTPTVTIGGVSVDLASLTAVARTAQPSATTAS